jgi:hypothetical protein
MSGDGNGNGSFTLGSFAWRLLFTLTLVMVTFNPSSYSYVQWLRTAYSADSLGPEHAVAGVAMLGAWLIVITATQRALGSLGLLVMAAFMGTLVWWLIDAGLLTANTMSSIEWVVLVCLAVLLAVGMSWSYIWRQITGQVSVDEVDH